MKLISFDEYVATLSAPLSRRDGRKTRDPMATAARRVAAQRSVASFAGFCAEGEANTYRVSRDGRGRRHLYTTVDRWPLVIEQVIETRNAREGVKAVPALTAPGIDKKPAKPAKPPTPTSED